MFHREVHVVAHVGVVQIAVRWSEISAQKIWSLLKHVQAEWPSIQLHKSARHARNRNTSGTEHFTAELFLEKRWIFDRVVQMEFLQTVATLPFDKFSEVHREPWLVI